MTGGGGAYALSSPCLSASSRCSSHRRLKYKSRWSNHQQQPIQALHKPQVFNRSPPRSLKPRLQCKHLPKLMARKEWKYLQGRGRNIISLHVRVATCCFSIHFFLRLSLIKACFICSQSKQSSETETPECQIQEATYSQKCYNGIE